MGTSLTGLTPSTTYDALIKVGDNGPLSGTQKRLSDGLGNDSAISLSTTALRVDGVTTMEQSSASVALTVSSGWGGGFDNPIMNFGRIGLAVNGQIGYDDPNTLLYIGTTTSHAFSIRTSNTERIRITPAGNVGIGTSSPSVLLEANGKIRTTRIGVASQYIEVDGGDASGGFITMGGAGKTLAIRNNSTGSSDVLFDQAVATRYTFAQAGTQILRIDADGIKFGTDSAAANALDDYEEGTFTPSLNFGGNSVGLTYFDRQGNYTKIGRQVTCTMYIAITAVGTSTGNATIDGLPFTSSNANRGSVSAVSFRFDNITFSGQFMGNLVQNGTSINLSSTNLLGVETATNETNFNGSSEFNAITVTYFTA
jgi:hypothetical protein